MSQTALQRVNALLDEASFVELGAGIRSRATDLNPDPKADASDGVVTGFGTIEGILVFVYAQDPDVQNGTVGEMHAKKICDVYRQAVRMGAPVIGLLDSAGVRLAEGTDALSALGSLYAASQEAAGAVPRIAAVFGSCGGGIAVLAGMQDVVLMEEKSTLFVSAPNARPGAKGGQGLSCEAYEAGNVDVVGSESEILSQIRTLIPMLPSSSRQHGVESPSTDDLNRASIGVADAACVQDAIRLLADNGTFFELRAGTGKDMCVGLTLLGGTATGVVANSREESGSLLSASGAKKAADFIRFCDAFHLPVLTLADVDGYVADENDERLLGEAAGLASAYASAVIPRITLIRKRVRGSAGLLMDPKALGCDLVYALSDASVEVMESDMAARLLGGSADNAAAFAAGLNASALARGLVDREINEADARKYLIAGFEMLRTKTAERSL